MQGNEIVKVAKKACKIDDVDNLVMLNDIKHLQKEYKSTNEGKYKVLIVKHTVTLKINSSFSAS